MQYDKIMHSATPFPRLLLLFLLISFTTLPSMANHSTFDNPDFAYPKEVSEDATSALDKALKRGDTDGIVAATLQLSKAGLSISRDNAPTLISKIEQTIAKTPDSVTKAMLYTIEANVYQSYHWPSYSDKSTATPDLSDDISEWSDEQFEQKIHSLVEQSMSYAQKGCMEAKVTDYPRSLRDGNGESKKVLNKVIDVLVYNWTSLDESAFDKAQEIFRQCHKGDTPALLYWQSNHSEIKLEDYLSQQDSEYSWWLLKKVQFDDTKRKHALYKDYLKRFANSIFASEAKHAIELMEQPSASVKSVQTFVPSSEEIAYTLDNSNTGFVKVSLYRVKDSALKRSDNSLRMKDVEHVDSHEHTFTDTIPFNLTQKGAFPAQAYGVYVIMIEGDIQSPFSDYITVTDLDYVRLNDSQSKTRKVLVVDGKTGRPVQDVTVTLQMEKNKRQNIVTLHSDKNGIVTYEPTSSNVTISISKGDDRFHSERFWGNTSAYRDKSGAKSYLRAYTDLAVYRPGDTVQYSAIAYSYDSKTGKGNPLERQKLSVTLSNANGKEIARDSLITNDWGAVNGTFTIPQGDMNGTFYISFRSEDKLSLSTSREIEVAEFKTPTFEIIFTDIKRHYNAGNGDIKISGTAKTYSGVPLAGVEVKLLLNESSLWWMRNSRDLLSQGGSVRTNDKGEWSITYKADTFKDRKFGFFSLSATVTNTAGETHSVSDNFFIGNGSRVIMESEKNLEVSKPCALPLSVETTSTDTTPQVCYTLTDSEGKAALSSEDYTTNTAIDFSAIPSGVYTLKAWIAGEETSEKDKSKCTLTLYRTTDKTYHTDAQYWIAEDAVKPSAKGKAKVLIGCDKSSDSHIYYTLTNGTEITSEGWKTLRAGSLQYISFDVDKSDMPSTLTLYSEKNFQGLMKSIQISPVQKADSLSVEIESFRDKVHSGDCEKWTLRFKRNGKLVEAASLVNVYNKALDAISPYGISFSQPKRDAMSYTFSHSDSYGVTISAQKPIFSRGEFVMITPPDWKYSFERHFSRMYMSPMLMCKNASLSVDEDKMVGYADESSNEGITALADTSLGSAPSASAKSEQYIRTQEVNSALWLPFTLSDKSGANEITFDTPAYNTTWALKILSYTRDLLSDVSEREITASKPIMVQSNLQRFLRRGDKATLNAVVINSTESAQKADITIELFNPLNNSVISTKSESIELEPMGQYPCFISLDVTDSIPALGYRIKAHTEGFSDGEQSIIPVLSDETAVIEAQPFFLTPAQHSLTKRIGDIPQGAKVTLEYCDNPVWYCLTALPSIVEESNLLTATGTAHTLYALLTAKGIASNNPSVKRAIEDWAKRDTTVLSSNLERNPELKITELSKSPFLRDSERETLQMRSIAKLFDDDYSDALIEKCSKRLRELQGEDGAISWISGSTGDLWATYTVLELIGELRQMGYMQDTTILGIAHRGIDFIDKEVIRRYNEQDDKRNYSIFYDYYYVRSLYPEVEMNKTLTTLSDNAVKARTEVWRNLSLTDKAFLSMLLQRKGQTAKAIDVVASIKQFAIDTPDKGTYWDTNDYSWRCSDPVASTTLLLEAINAVTPEDSIIDKVRSWIVYQKQTNAWGGSSMAAHAVHTLLSNDTNWLTNAGTTHIAIAGSKITFDETESRTGYCLRTIEMPQKGDILSIDRSADTQAWGCLYAQYQAPMTEVKAAATNELSIAKNLYRVDSDGKLAEATDVKVGDRLRILLTIKNANDLSYVSIRDERSATLEPVDQLSGNTYFSDGICGYQETKDDVTNIFLYHLPKGTFKIAYDVTVTSEGTYSFGVASVQCQYSPLHTAHSAGTHLSVTK